eukprot:TRINITY_DN21705_c0_g1_i1.p1 TRINITY_DN21705_c0_g1~~TRINITY_DN21705_c0_g1_i1.p1  ORF type:complete len:361 (+),score=45.94 TRINITY_DN21705_c0_g1_i1:97-1179(+)
MEAVAATEGYLLANADAKVETCDQDAVLRVEKFFAANPGSTLKQASDKLNMSIHRVKRLRKKSRAGNISNYSSCSTIDNSRVVARPASDKHDPKTKMHANAKTMTGLLQHTAYTQITFSNQTTSLFVLEPSVLGHALWSEWLEKHPFPHSSAGLDSMLRQSRSVVVASAAVDPEELIGRLFRDSGDAGLFGLAQSRELYRHDFQRELYELACSWNKGGRNSSEAARRIKEIGKAIYEMGQEAAAFDDHEMNPWVVMMSEMLEQTGRLPFGVEAKQFENVRRLYGTGHASMRLHFLGLGILTGVFDEVTNTEVPASRHDFPVAAGHIVKMHHTKNLRGDLEITGWQCVVEMLWHGIGTWEN